MSKAKSERTIAENEAMAVNRGMRISPRKLNLVATMIRGKKAERALNELYFMRKRIAKDVYKTLQAAIANAENNHGLDIDNLIVSEAFVGKGIVMRRFRPRAKGRASKISKPFSNLKIIVRSF